LGGVGFKENPSAWPDVQHAQAELDAHTCAHMCTQITFKEELERTEGSKA
jgi:hypothetical protein